MGGTYELLGPYPPQALMLGLDNAYTVYRGEVPPVSPIPTQPAFLVMRRDSGYVLRCLEFGSLRHPIGSVCLRPSGVIASYELSESVTSGPYETALLRRYSPGVSDHAFNLPATPSATN
jgi:hypothetical protein